jgi:hypothetical protein
MKSTGLVKGACALTALAMLSACGGAAVAPSNAVPDVRYIGRTLSVNERLVAAAAKSKHLEYIIDDYGTYAGIFDYPKSVQQIGTIKDVGGQGCTNVLYGWGKKIFWIVAADTQIAEYQVPKKLIKTLSDSFGQPSSCAMDSSGDLAVGGLENGDIAIYPNASGSGTVMTTPLAMEYFDGYDPKGDLFADGINRSDEFGLIELAKGSSEFQTITTSNIVKEPGSVQWDGKYLTVEDMEASDIYRYTVSGTKATLEGTVSLSGAGDCTQTWIATGVVFCADARNDDGEVFKYPAGGSILATFTGSFDVPLGVVAVDK